MKLVTFTESSATLRLGVLEDDAVAVEVRTGIAAYALQVAAFVEERARLAGPLVDPPRHRFANATTAPSWRTTPTSKCAR